MPVAMAPGSSSSWFEKGSRIVLKPAAFIWSSMSCQLRAHSPCGAKLAVSNPNQVTPVNRTSWPLASTIFAPAVCSGTFTAVPAGLFGGAGAPVAGAGYGVAEVQGAGDDALPDGALPDGALPDGALPDGALLCGAVHADVLPCGALPWGALPCGALLDGALPCGALPPELPDPLPSARTGAAAAIRQAWTRAPDRGRAISRPRPAAAVTRRLAGQLAARRATIPRNQLPPVSLSVPRRNRCAGRASASQSRPGSPTEARGRLCRSSPTKWGNSAVGKEACEAVTRAGIRPAGEDQTAPAGPIRTPAGTGRQLRST